MTEVKSESSEVLTASDHLDHWLDKHKEGKTPWHNEHKHPFLADNVEVLFGDNGKIHKVLIPLCGKAVEMSWFAELGHSVVGIEASSIPIKDFFSENNVKYSVEDIGHIPGQVYKAEEVNIKIYCCDIFDFTKDLESEFDVIWDRGALGGIYPDDRRRYATLMSSLMTSDCRYLSCIHYYGDKAREEAGLPPDGNPYVIPLNQVQEVFASLCQVELLVKRPKDKNQMGGKPVSQEVGDFLYNIKKC